MEVALLGYGYWGKIVETYIHSNKFMDLKKIYVRNKPRDQGDIFTSDLDDIMTDDEIEAVFVCLPASMHFDICKIALEKGKHIFCEKPLVKFGQDHSRLEELAGTVQRILYTDYIYTASPSIARMKENLSALGDIYLIEGQLFQFGKFYQGDSIWENIGIHLISVLCDWFPTINIKKIERYSQANGNVECVSLEDEQGMQVKLECSLLCPCKKRCIYVYGQMGSMCFDMLDPDATVRMNLFDANKNGVQLSNASSWKYDEGNNLEFSIQRFTDFIKAGNYASNLQLSRQTNALIHRILRT